MTAPTPAHLRLLATAPDRPGNGWRISALAALHDSADALEVERANHEATKSALDQAWEQLHQARKQLADAPQDRMCGSHPMNGVSDHGCTYWKAEL